MFIVCNGNVLFREFMNYNKTGKYLTSNVKNINLWVLWNKDVKL